MREGPSEGDIEGARRTMRRFLVGGALVVLGVLVVHPVLRGWVPRQAGSWFDLGAALVLLLGYVLLGAGGYLWWLLRRLRH